MLSIQSVMLIPLVAFLTILAILETKILSEIWPMTYLLKINYSSENNIYKSSLSRKVFIMTV